MKYGLRFIGIFLLLALPALRAGQIRRIMFHGNQAVSREELLRFLDLSKGVSFLPGDEKEIVNRTLVHYRENGFLLASADSVRAGWSADSQRVDLTLWITENRPVCVNTIRIASSDSEMDGRLLQEMEMRPGRVFSESVLEDDVQSLLTFLENNGHPLSEVEIASFDLSTDTDRLFVDIVLKVHTGPEIVIGTVRIEGNRVTKEKVVLRESRLVTGNRYRHDEVVRTQEVLQRTDLFQEVMAPDIRFSGDRAFVTLTVKEGNVNTFDGIVGYVPSGENEEEKGYMTGRLQFIFRNLLGTGRFLEAYWEKKDRYSQSMRFGYEEPWIFSRPLSAGIGFQQEIRDTTYIEREWTLSLKYRPWQTLTFQLNGGRRDVLPDSLGSVIYDLARTESWFVSASIDYNTFDDPVNPSKGVRYHTLYRAGVKKNLGPDDVIARAELDETVSTQRIQIDAEAVLPLFSQQVLFSGLHGAEVKTGDPYVPVSDQVRFGGTRSVRGYAEDLFNGTLVVWANLEYRFLTGRRSRLFLFADAGMTQRKEKDAGRIRGDMFGYGVGLRLETKLGLIGIDYGIGEGDTFLRGKIHVGLVNRF